LQTRKGKLNKWREISTRDNLRRYFKYAKLVQIKKGFKSKSSETLYCTVVPQGFELRTHLIMSKHGESYTPITASSASSTSLCTKFA